MHGVTKLLKKEGGGCSCLLLRSVLSFSTKEDKKKFIIISSNRGISLSNNFNKYITSSWKIRNKNNRFGNAEEEKLNK